MPLSSEFRVNAFTTGGQSTPAVAVDGDGDFVVVWQSEQDGGSGSSGTTGVYAQRFNLSGVPQGAEFRVNTYTTGRQDSPSIAMDSDGDFVVAWASYGQDGSNYGIFAKRYNAAGVLQGSEFRVNSYTANSQYNASVAMDADGDFVVAWQSYAQDGYGFGVYAQRYNAAGAVQGGEFRVNSYTNSPQDKPAVAMDASGDFVVTWTSNYQDGSFKGIYAQRYNAAGTAQGGEFRVNTFTTNFQTDSAVAMDADGDFVIAWQSGFVSGVGQDGSLYGIYARRYNAAGVAQEGVEFRVNSYTTDYQRAPTVSMDVSGDFVVVWESNGQEGSGLGVYAQQFDSSGLAVGSESLVNTYTTNAQGGPAVAMDADGDFVAAWTSGVGQDGSGNGVYARQYGRPPIALGGEFRVNSYTPLNQVDPKIAMDADGDFVVVWQGQVSLDDSDIYAQRYNAAGVAQGAEFRVNTVTTREQGTPAVAMDADGDFVVAWHSRYQDGYVYGVFAQRFNASGVAHGSEFRVNTYTPDAQIFPDVAMDADGDFVVVWHTNGQDGSSYGVYGQRYSAAGVPVGGEFRVNTYVTDSQHSLAVAMEADGDFVVAWVSTAQPGGSSFDIYAQRYSAAGATIGGEFRVNTYTTSLQSEPAVAIDGDGDFVVAWRSGGQDGDADGVYAQRYNAAGMAQGVEFRVNMYTTSVQMDPSVAMDSDGDFVVAWHSYGQEVGVDSPSIYALRYNAAGVAQGVEFQVNTYTTNPQRSPAVAMDSDGDFVVAWQSNGQDGSINGIYAQRYGVASPSVTADYDDDGDVDAADINILADMIFRGASDPGNNDSADLNGIGGVTQDDMDYMVNTILETVYGDADLDDDVDGADFDAWRIRDSLGGGIGWATGDWDGDNDVDGADFDHWRLRLPAIGGAGSHLPLGEGQGEGALGATGFASAAATSTTRSLSNSSMQSTAAARAHAERGRDAALAKPVAHEHSALISAVDEALSTSPMYRSRHLRRAAVPAAALHDALLAAWR